MRTTVWLQAAKRRKKCEIPGFFQRFLYFWRKSVLAVPVCLMTVFPGGFPVALDLGLRQGTDHLGGAAQDHGAGGSVHFAGDQCPGAYNAVIADLCTVENGGAHADEHIVAHGAAVDNGPVADGAAGTDRGLLVQHWAVLNVGVVAHFDGAVISAEDGMQPIDVDKQYHFFNPRAGVSYTLAERNNFYLSFAVAQKEPTRSDFTDRYMFAEANTYPSSEKLYDWELGYQYTAPRLSLGVNLYYMKYKDQLVPTGMVNDGSDALNTNVPDSYRRGVELSASWRATGWFTVGANATFSQNRIESYVDALKDSPTYGKELGDMTIAYSPDVIANAFLNFHHRGFEAVFHTQHVGKQYFTNNENDALSLDAYCVTNLNLAYTFRTRSARSVRLGLLINNLFNAEYESNGYGYSYMDTWSGPAPVRIDEAYYFPQAPLNVLANVTVKF